MSKLSQTAPVTSVKLLHLSRLSPSQLYYIRPHLRYPPILLQIMFRFVEYACSIRNEILTASWLFRLLIAHQLVFKLLLSWGCKRKWLIEKPNKGKLVRHELKLFWYSFWHAAKLCWVATLNSIQFHKVIFKCLVKIQSTIFIRPNKVIYYYKLHLRFSRKTKLLYAKLFPSRQWRPFAYNTHS